jgi:hypothetical protein
MIDHRRQIANRPARHIIFILHNPNFSTVSKLGCASVLIMKSSPNALSTVTLAEARAPKPDGLDASHRKDFGFIPIPQRLRYDPDKPFDFGIVLNVSFGFMSTFSESIIRKESAHVYIANALAAANLYYCQPLLSGCLLDVLGKTTC